MIESTILPNDLKKFLHIKSTVANIRFSVPPKSGGKDSCYNMMQCVAEGHQIVALANLKPQDKDELDSYMYQTVGHHAIELYAEAMDLPLYRRTITGASLEQGKDYTQNPEDEVEDLYKLLLQVREETGGNAVSVGAILSDYQRVRVEHVCMRLGLTPLAYLWRREQPELLKEMIDCNVDAILIKVAALGLEPKKHLGKTLSEIYPHMLKMQDMYGLNVCGEGGEYETFTLNCPLFKKKIVLDETKTVVHSDDAFAPVAYLNLLSMHLEDQIEEVPVLQSDRIKNLPMKTSRTLKEELDVSDCEEPKHEVTDVCEKCVQERLQGGPVAHIQQVGDTFHVTGIYGTETDVQQATKQAFDQLIGSLKEHNLCLSNLAAVYLYVADMKQFKSINNIYKTYFSLNPPIRVCVEVPLPENTALQLDCVATSQPRSTMHVQGLSHWAPANIGPYSQAVKVGSCIYVAGQIAMTPADLSIIPGGPIAEARLSLRHVQRVLAAIHPGCGMGNIVMVICYVTKSAYAECVLAEWKRANEGSSEALLTFVVVPALPKGALVEWQVRAEKQDQAEEEDEEDIQRQDKGAGLQGTTRKGCLTLQYEGTVKNSRICALLLTITRSDETTDISAVDVISLLLATLGDIMDQKFGTVRVFFDGSILQEAELLKEYKAVDHTTAIHFIPVLGFPQTNCLLTACY